MSSSDTQDTSYSPETFDLLDYKVPSQGDELRANLPKLRTGPGSMPGRSTFAPFPRFPKFPTLFDLAKTAPEPSQKKNPPGLFEQYLSKEPEHILQDARVEPDRYDSRALSLLTDIYEGRKKWETVTPVERRLLDEATMEFFSPTKKIQSHSLLAPSPTAPTTSGSVPTPKPVLGPVLDAFWWSR